MTDPVDLEAVKARAAAFKGHHSAEQNMAAVLSARDVPALVAEVERLWAELDEAQLRSIEARNPGIDMDEVRRIRSKAAAHPSEWGVVDV
jgi:uncharacterized protein (DUF1697 family)